MNTEEFATMYRVEDRHWWYAGLRRLLETSWRRHVVCEAPRVLDAGCGTGATLAAACPRSGSFGVDISMEAVGYCRKRGLTRTAAASASALPFGDNAFDVVLSLDVIQHKDVSDPRVPLREACRVLTRGGVLFVNVPAYRWLYSSHDSAVSNVRRFTRGELASRFAEAGLATIEVTYWNALLFPAAALLRLWRKHRPPQGSDLTHVPGPGASAALGFALTCERALLRLTPLPFGLSVFGVARKE